MRCSNSNRRLDCDDATGDGGPEPPASEEVRPSSSRRELYVDDDALERAGTERISSGHALEVSSFSWNKRHDSRWSANNDARLSCGEVRAGGTGTMLAVVTALLEECNEP